MATYNGQYLAEDENGTRLSLLPHHPDSTQLAMDVKTSKGNSTTVFVLPADVPEIALKMLQAAGFQDFNGDLSGVLKGLKAYLTKQAEDTALEQEARRLFAGYRSARSNVVPWDEQGDDVKLAWLEAAREARKLYRSDSTF